MSKSYEAPQVYKLGTVTEKTEGGGPNKIGSANDKFTNATGLNGTIVPQP